MDLTTATLRLQAAFLELVVVGVQAFGSHILAERVTQPGERLVDADRFGASFRRRRPICRAAEAIGDVVHVQIEVIRQEGADVGVLVVPDEGPGVFGGGGVDIHVDTCANGLARVPQAYAGNLPEWP